MPISIERSLGEAADSHVRSMFGTKQCAGPAGAAALAKLSARLRSASDLRLPATIIVLASKTPNAFALPGGKVYLLSGLLDKAENQDEMLGVLAHELGHSQHRDHLRRMIVDGGAAYLIGLLFGHVTGGGAIIYASKTLLFAAHSRESEAAADAFAAATLAKLGRPARPMGELLLRVTGPEGNGATAILHDHPLSRERLDYLAARDKGATGPAVLGDEEWAALKAICEWRRLQPRLGGRSKPRLRHCRFMLGRGDLDKFVARFVQCEEARILDLEEGAVQFQGFDPLQSGDFGKCAQIAQALFDRFKAESLRVGSVEGRRNWAKSPRGWRDQSDPVAKIVVALQSRFRDAGVALHESPHASAFGVAEHDDMLNSQGRDRVINRRPGAVMIIVSGARRNQIGDIAHIEQFARFDVKNLFRRDAGIATADYQSVRMLADRGQILESLPFARKLPG